MRKSALIIAVVMVAAVGAAVWVAAGRHGLLPGLDFGPGQYYYTDIPNWERYFSVDGIAADCPALVYYLVFAIWGWLMYCLWRWIDRR